MSWPGWLDVAFRDSAYPSGRWQACAYQFDAVADALGWVTGYFGGGPGLALATEDTWPIALLPSDVATLCERRWPEWHNHFLAVIDHDGLAVAYLLMASET